MPIFDNDFSGIENYFSNRRAMRSQNRLRHNPASKFDLLLNAGEALFARDGDGKSPYSKWKDDPTLNSVSDAASGYVSPWVGLGAKALGAGILAAVETGNPLVGLLAGGTTALTSLPGAISEYQDAKEKQNTIKKQQEKEQQQQEAIIKFIEKYIGGKPAANIPTAAYSRGYSTLYSPMKQTDMSGFTLLVNPRNSARIRHQNLYNV